MDASQYKDCSDRVPVTSQLAPNHNFIPVNDRATNLERQRLEHVP
ncbi:hypothetical protein [Reyranella sp.]|nr:hypothetical protein [Reyranella sp.]MDP2376219.1 hypothetical protein [Reyranella sp.]